MATASDDFSSYTAGAALNGPWTQDFSTSGTTVIKGTNGGNAIEAGATNNWGYAHRNDISPGGAQFSKIFHNELFQGGFARLLLRMSGANATLAGYALEWSPGSTSGQIVRIAAGADAATIKTITFPHAVTQEYIEFDASGSTLSVYQAGSLVDTATDSTLTTGNVGVGHNNAGANAGVYGQLTLWSGGDLSAGSSGKLLGSLTNGILLGSLSA